MPWPEPTKILLAMKPAIRPKTIQAMIPMKDPLLAGLG